MESQECPPALVLEGHARDRALFAFVVGPDDAFVRHHLEIFAIEGHGVRTAGAEFEPIFAAGADVHLARYERNAGHRFWHPPALEQLGLAPRLVNRARRRIECPGYQKFAIPLALD
ncbi:hypothetical protein RHECNPAF_1260068 [Rhizobium etli CNPAF512]|nr:hypothetical protein RHECNPAF_1260068 [Rhizobium etli CNPAF512]